MNQRKYKHIFGPVPSRRLGRSLGVDLVPFKACPFDCTYCQLGRTTNKTAERREYVPTQEVLDELAERFASEPNCCDVVTLSGSGEPTLHSGLGRVIAGIKAVAKVPVVVLTNGALLSDPQVRRELLRADIVAPDLDAGDEETFQKINRPCGGVTLRAIVEGLKAFRREYRGQLCVEVFAVAGVNDSDEQMGRIAAILDEIRPDQIDLNTVARPPAEATARAVDPARLERLRQILGPKARIIAPRAGAGGTGAAGKDAIADMVRRHPCTLEDIVTATGAPRAEVERLLAELVNEGRLSEKRVNGGSFYSPP